jgi:hypothetical protein
LHHGGSVLTWLDLGVPTHDSCGRIEDGGTWRELNNQVETLHNKMPPCNVIVSASSRHCGYTIDPVSIIDMEVGNGVGAKIEGCDPKHTVLEVVAIAHRTDLKSELVEEAVFVWKPLAQTFYGEPD